MDFEDLYRLWRQETFEVGAFGLDQDIDAYLDDPETGIGQECYDEYAEELLDYELPDLDSFF